MNKQELIWEKVTQLEKLTENIILERIQDDIDFLDCLDELKELTKPF